MIPITPDISIDDSAIEERFIRASGPGGQNVNKVATAVQLRFDAANAASLPGDVRARLVRLAGRRMTTEGVLVIEARRFRTRERNRADALARLTALIRRAAEPPKPRRKTRPPRASKARRLETKRRRGTIKRTRAPVPESERE
ncbi:MAG: aminoacyl-tRNA hydrolase [Gemmatimonadetes bacterium]|nr:aminoacyl-tRNA hydrolase [Gemmatimonadota bacterium]